MHCLSNHVLNVYVICNNQEDDKVELGKALQKVVKISMDLKLKCNDIVDNFHTKARRRFFKDHS